MLRLSKKVAGVAALILGATLLPALGSTANAATPVTITYGMWDDRQMPAYQACADAFQIANPGITIKITQSGWSDYWNTVTTGFANGNGFDVITDHLAYYQDLVNANQILDLTPYVAAAKVNLKQYQPGLAELWTKNGKRYGLPKDFDTIAIAYNSAAATKDKITAAQLKTITWNPKNGGSWERILKMATIDKKGNNALSPKFDKKNVVTFGLNAPDKTTDWGQTDWSTLAVSNGFQFLNKNPWGNHYNFDSPALAQTLAWYRKGIAGGWILDPRNTGNLGAPALMEANKIVFSTNGSWEINGLVSAKVPVKFAALPLGPKGRHTMFNGLADSVNAATKNPAEAVKWALYLGSSACQDIVAAHAVVFPAIKTSTVKAFAAFKAKGAQIDGFTSEVNPRVTFIPPMSENAKDVAALFGPYLTKIYFGQGDPQALLTEVNKKINALFTN